MMMTTTQAGALIEETMKASLSSVEGSRAHHRPLAPLYSHALLHLAPLEQAFPVEEVVGRQVHVQAEQLLPPLIAPLSQCGHCIQECLPHRLVGQPQPRQEEQRHLCTHWVNQHKKVCKQIHWAVCITTCRALIIRLPGGFKSPAPARLQDNCSRGVPARKKARAKKQ